MQRTLQLQVLTFLASLATLGAALRPTFDTLLFAVAFVFGTLLMQVRDRLEYPRETKLSMLGKIVGAALPWSFAAIRAFAHHLTLPPRLTSQVIVAAAVVPTGVMVIDLVRALRNGTVSEPERQPD